MAWRVLIAAVAAFFAASAIAQTAAKPDNAKQTSCEGELFEFSATSGGHLTRVTLCGKKDGTPTENAAMFKEAVVKLQENGQLDPGRRAQLVAQIKAKIAEMEGKAAASISAPSLPSSLTAKPTPKLANTNAKSEYSAMPPLSVPKRAAIAPSASADLAADYSTLPPLPAPRTVAAESAAAASLPVLSRPRLTISCSNPADLAGASPCADLDRDTRLVVRAGETVPLGTSLRFVRRGDLRAEVELAQLTAGKAIQFPLPQQVCSGVVESKVEIQVVRKTNARDSAGRVVDSIGPYLLRC